MRLTNHSHLTRGCHCPGPMVAGRPILAGPAGSAEDLFCLDPLLHQHCYTVPRCADFGEQLKSPASWRCHVTGQEWSSLPAAARRVGEPERHALSLSGYLRRQTQAAPVTRTRSAPSNLAAPAGAKVRPLRQTNRSSCGQTSVAMSINSVTGSRLTDADIDRRYGFRLLHALNSESRRCGIRWHDGGNFSSKNWPTLEKKLNSERMPVMIGLNGPAFSPSGRGHIVTLLSVEGTKVRYADPVDGRVKVTTRSAIESAPPHPDGKFFFYASRQ